MSAIARSSWSKRIIAGFAGAVGLAVLCLPTAPAKAQVSFGFSVPGVSVGIGAPGYYYAPPYYGYPYYYGYPAYGGAYLHFGGHHYHHDRHWR